MERPFISILLVFIACTLVTPAWGGSAPTASAPVYKPGDRWTFSYKREGGYDSETWDNGTFTAVIGNDGKLSATANAVRVRCERAGGASPDGMARGNAPARAMETESEHLRSRVYRLLEGSWHESMLFYHLFRI